MTLSGGKKRGSTQDCPLEISSGSEDEGARRARATFDGPGFPKQSKSTGGDVVRLIETADAGKPAPPSRVVIKLPRYDYDEIIDALEGEEDDAADSGGEDYELAG